MVALDVRVDVGAVFAGVGAVRALEARRLAALVLDMPVQSAVPLVGFAARGALEGAARRGVYRSGQPDVAPTPAFGRDQRCAVGGARGATEEHCKSTGSFVSRVRALQRPGWLTGFR